ncbi:MAG: OB-fold nucleic acid binding domain-containing protein [Candidatus Diapherotrites archaeon]|nr:OB-fold nucleic acid binding domain-containing protein [Candidatus Diapherotrites archaeon]
MEFLSSSQNTISLISEKTGKPKQEIEELIKQKKEKFAGMLTDDGAAFMVAKELKVELALEKRISEKTSIALLEAGMSNVDLEARVVQAFQTKSFEKNSKKGKMLNLIIADENSEIRLTLWHDMAKKFEEQKIEKGARLALSNCRVAEFQGKKQLSLDYNGSFAVLEEGKEKTQKLEELKDGMQNIDVIGRIARVYPVKKFLKDNKEGKILNFELSDGKNSMRCTAWNELAEEAENMKQNELVKIENAYTKQGLRAVELHLGWQARIIKSPKTAIQIPEIISNQYPKEKFAQLEENKSFEQKALVIDLSFGKVFFEVCPKCGKKPDSIDGALICDNCGQIQETEKRIAVSALLDDGSAVIRTVFFGKQAEELLGISSKELQEKQKQGKLNEELQKISEKIAGEEIIIQAVARTNLMNGKLEATARNVRKAAAEKTEIETNQIK